MNSGASIGVFDSGIGGLTVLKEFVKLMPDYNYIYLGDNARTPYGNRSFETVYEYTLQCVKKLFEMNCPLVILACNTASAKALRNIQQKDLSNIDSSKRVLGVIRPTSEMVGKLSKTKKVGVFATAGTVSSETYPIEIKKFFPAVEVFQQACPMLVPLIENNESDMPGADYFVKKYCGELMQKDKDIDTVVLGCTHYPILIDKIKAALPLGVNVVSQGEIVAQSLKDYLHRHPEMDRRLGKSANLSFFATDSPHQFDKLAGLFFGVEVSSNQINL
ncbi:MAG TPA: glutamate racemase [Bacteroidia bacterium]|nr:glutamate racemase [Bacteroidia bacterium]HNU34321.1 glutamate racemase [Bacteroidia bacterium]